MRTTVSVLPPLLALAAFLTGGIPALCQASPGPADPAPTATSGPTSSGPTGPTNPPVAPSAAVEAPSASSRPAILHWWDDAAFDRRVTLVLKDADLNASMDALGKLANMSLIASGGTKARKKISLNLRSAPLRDVMLALANLYDLEWFQAGQVYILTYVSASTGRGRRTAAPRPALTPMPRQRVIVIPEKPAPTTRAPSAPAPRNPQGADKRAADPDARPGR